MKSSNSFISDPPYATLKTSNIRLAANVGTYLKTFIFALVAFALNLTAQTAVTLSGTITDPSGAAVPSAQVTLACPGKPTLSATTGADGTYGFAQLSSLTCNFQVAAPGLSQSKPARVTLKPGPQVLNLQLKVAQVFEQITVEAAPGSTLNTTDPTANATAKVIQGQDLDALADDPNDLAADLQALAGPAAGPSGGQIFIDGFSGGQIPSKEAIREIRINQNPFSPQFEKLGLGRIEILTKPGAGQFHGSVFFNYANDVTNSRNPYAGPKAPFHLREFGGSLSGPLSKRASYFVDARQDFTDNGAIINGVILDPRTNSDTPFSDVYRMKQRASRLSPRVDYQLTQTNTLSARYAYSHFFVPGAGIGSFNLPSRGYDNSNDSHTIQLSDTAIISPKFINELRFQFFRVNVDQNAFSSDPTVQVAGAFTKGSAGIGHSTQSQDSYEVQDYMSYLHGPHTIRYGIRFRAQTDSSYSPQNFTGTFTFSGLPGITSIEQYRRTLLYSDGNHTPEQIRALGGGASQFTINTGNPALSARQYDVSAFIGDDWTIRPNLSLGLGLRYEIQTNIGDHRSFAPRVAIAWSPGSGSKNTSPKNVIRAGFGMFYDRFALANTITAQRYNGALQQQYVIKNPDFFLGEIPKVSLLGDSQQILQRVSPLLRAPYIMQAAASFERQLPHRTTLALTFAMSHGLHQLRSRDVNAPLPGTNKVYPFQTPGPIFLMESAGLYNQNQFMVDVNTKVAANVSLLIGYMLNKANSNTDGLSTFPANQYSMAGEYGPASTDMRQRFFVGGSINTKWDIRMNPLVTLESGRPFDITTGQDFWGTTLFNARPALATNPSKPGLIQTSYGLFDPSPDPGQPTISRNYGRGPGQYVVNLRLSKTVGFGPAKEGPKGSGGFLSGIFTTAPASHPYTLNIALSIRNALNHTNPRPITGNLTSPIFGQANQPAGARDLGGGGLSEAANNRRLEWQIRFSF